MKRILVLMKNFCINIMVALVNIFIRRDRNVILFGAWMGQRYADNSRYLYEYVATHKSKLGLKRVIWVSTNHDVIDYLSKRGFEVYFMYSFSSIYWHLKSGMHFVCNMYAKTGKYNGDILGELSCGAKKVQLWHGVAIKACGKLVSKTLKKDIGIRHKMKKNLLSSYLFGNAIFSPGCWTKRYHLTTGSENSRVAILDYGVAPDRIIEANYPREQDDIEYLPHEKMIIEDLVKLKDRYKYKLILYCPTFREMSQINSLYQNPIKNDNFKKFLKSNNFLWIEKRHFASTFKFDLNTDSNIYIIEPDVDINILYRYIDLMVTDYSSAASDFIFRMKKVVSFIPDICQYESEERGFVCEYDKYYPGEKSKCISELERGILISLNDSYLSGANLKRYILCKEFLFSDKECNTVKIWEKIINKLY